MSWGMTGLEPDPATLFRLYVDYSRYAEATNLFLEYMESFTSLVTKSFLNISSALPVLVKEFFVPSEILKTILTRHIDAILDSNGLGLYRRLHLIIIVINYVWVVFLIMLIYRSVGCVILKSI